MNYEIKIGDRIGAYQVIAYVNKGGMAQVVLAETYGNRRFALKIARDTQDPKIYKQNKNAILKETELLRKFQHDRIVKVYPLRIRTGTLNSRGRNNLYNAKLSRSSNSPWYFAMEYLEGGTFDDYIKKCGPLEVDEATNIVGNVCLGIRHMHVVHKVSHNDIKPENVVFRKRIVKGMPYDPVLIDFGTVTSINHFVDNAGSLFTMSPERVSAAKGLDAPEVAEKNDPRQSDVWSVGILLYYALTGKLPFASKKEQRLTTEILKGIPEPIMKFGKKVPQELDDYIVNGCLAKRPEDRPTIKELMDFIFVYSGRGVKAQSIKDGYYGRN